MARNAVNHVRHNSIIAAHRTRHDDRPAQAPRTSISRGSVARHAAVQQAAQQTIVQLVVRLVVRQVHEKSK